MEFNTSWNALLRPGHAQDFFKISLTDTVKSFIWDYKYNPVNAWWLSEISRLIYRNNHTFTGEKTREDFLKEAGLHETHFIKISGVTSAIITDKGSSEFAILVFRGSANLKNWISNLKAIKAKWPKGGHVHLGFMKAFEKIWPELDKIISSIPLPLFYTGHSLGAALATLAASVKPPVALYTFGSPKTGDREFADSLSPVSIYRIINNLDIVPRLPPASCFTHVGKPIHFADRKRIIKQKPHDPPLFLSDHAPFNYSVQLGKLF